MQGMSQQLKAYMSELREDLKASKEQLKIYRQIRKGTLVYAEFVHISVARSGVQEWIDSYRPTLLKYRDWTYHDKGFALEFDVVASEDPQPYDPQYQQEYSGKQAQIRGPKYYIASKIKVVPIGDLPLYIPYLHKTALFDQLLKQSGRDTAKLTTAA
jgi:hypothetical protein